MTKLLIAPLQEEMAAFTQSLYKHKHSATSIPIGRLTAQYFEGLDSIVACGGHGKTQFAIHTQHLLDHAHTIDQVVCFGAAGALTESLAVGDLVVATETIEHDYTLRFVRRPLPRFAANPNTIQMLQQLPLHSLPYRTHFEIIASGDEDIIEQERAITLQQSTHAYAVAWEGAGGARACQFSKVPFVEIRGITDTANHDAPDDFTTNVSRAMAHIASLITLWLTK